MGQNLGMKLCDWQKFKKLHIYTSTLFLRQKVKIELIFALRKAVSHIQAIFWHETLPLAQVPEAVHINSLALGVEISLFSFYGHRFPRYESIFIIAIFGDELWLSVKVL